MVVRDNAIQFSEKYHARTAMRYERLNDLMNLAIRMQSSLSGVTLEDIESELNVSRRTAERLRDTVERTFGALEQVPSNDGRRHWRIRSRDLRRLISISTEDFSTLSLSVAALERAGLGEHAKNLSALTKKLQAIHDSENLDQIESDLELLVQVEGLAMRPGPRERVDTELLELLRESILRCNLVEFHYSSRWSGRQRRYQVKTYGLLYGNRAYLVAQGDQDAAPHLWRLANISDAKLLDVKFERDREFDLTEFAQRSFGSYQEEPIDVVLRFDSEAAPDASTFLFHASQSVEQHDDGTITVRFKAGGLDEICWHLVTWGEHVVVESPLNLRKRMSEMCVRLGSYHGKSANA